LELGCDAREVVATRRVETFVVDQPEQSILERVDVTRADRETNPLGFDHVRE
jgi:hypothetical protein